MPEKKKRLFYWEEAVNSYIPVPEKLEYIIDESMLSHEETQEIKFIVFEMTDEEFNNLPES